MGSDLTTPVTDLAIIGVIWALVQWLKRLLEATIMPPTHPVHDTVIQATAGFLALGAVVLRDGVPPTGNAALVLTISALGIALGALGVHGVASNVAPGLGTALAPPQAWVTTGAPARVADPPPFPAEPPAPPDPPR